jgi:hypothetical protein
MDDHFQVYLVPPMARGTPYWYRRYHPSVMAAFREAFRNCEEGIFVMQAFSNPLFEKDQIHLNEDSGPA